MKSINPLLEPGFPVSAEEPVRELRARHKSRSQHGEVYRLVHNDISAAAR
jgi:hypothetical protein